MGGAPGVSKESLCASLACPAANQDFHVVCLVLGLPTLAFLAFMALRFRRTQRKLRFSALEVVFCYLALWVVSSLFLVRSVGQAAGLQGKQTVLWNLLCLVTRCATVMLEAFVVVFFLHGHLAADSSEALLKTAAASWGIALADSVVAAAVLFGGRVPLFVEGGPGGSGARTDFAWAKWGFYLAHALAGAACYGAVLALLARWRARLPARPAFYAFFSALLVLDLLRALGALLLGTGATAGYCVFGVAGWVYTAAFPPLLYYTFLAHALPAGGPDPGLDSLYYSEMHEAGYFDGSGEGCE